MPPGAMGYRVRNEHGELRFKSFEELKSAYVHSMVGSEDDVNEDGSAQWRKAGAIPQLQQAMASRPTAFQREKHWYALVALLVAAGAYFVVFGWSWVSFAIVAVLVTALMTWTTYSASRRRR